MVGKHGGFSSSLGDQKELPGGTNETSQSLLGSVPDTCCDGWGALRTRSVLNPVLGKVPATVQPLCQRPHVPDQLPLTASLLKGRVHPSPSLDPTCLSCPEGSGLCETIMVVGQGVGGGQVSNTSVHAPKHFCSCRNSPPYFFLRPPPSYSHPPNRELFHSVSHMSLFSLRDTLAWCLWL